MPAWGLIPDSPIFFWGARAARRLRSGRVRGFRSSPSISITFKKLTIYKPILRFEMNHRMGMVGEYLHSKARKIELGAKRQVGVKTGALRASIHIEHITSPRGQAVKIGSKLHYAYLHHEGSKPHIIVPTTPRALRFFSKGVLVHTMLVRHPGTKPNRYLSDQLALHIR
jgi:hypothetical protein